MKILAVGMNYAEHNKDAFCALNERKAPVIFSKADSALLTRNRPFFIPSFTQRCECGAGLVVRICRLGRSISRRWAHRYYDEVTLGVDFTARDLQDELMGRGLPWELCKGFDGSAAVGKMLPLKQLGDVQNLSFWLELNGQMVQRGDTAEMLFSVNEIVSYVSGFFTLKMGDLIFTGTPAGTSVVKENDHITGFLSGEKVLDFNVK